MKHLAALLFLTLAAGPSWAQCFPFEAVAKELTETHKETPQARAVTSQGHGMTIWVGPEGSFTITLHPQPGVACIAATGESWELAKPKGQGS
jgi:hypothetical protein